MHTIIERPVRRLAPFQGYTPGTAQRQASVSVSRSAADAPPSPQPGSASPKRTEVPERYTRLEPARPTIAIDDDPVFNELAAGRILGVTDECMKKWRQRNQGPDFIQYGEGGAVRYALNDLLAYRAAHTVRMK
jgi:hypothetical protein